MGQEPPYRIWDGLAQAMGGLEAERLLRPRHVNAAARLFIGFGCIPPDGTGEPNLGRDHQGKFADRNPRTGAQVDRFEPAIALGGQHNALGRVHYRGASTSCRPSFVL